jgi:hypothetical protein
MRPMRVSAIVVPHFGHGGRVTALDDARVMDDGIGLNSTPRELFPLADEMARVSSLIS